MNDKVKLLLAVLGILVGGGFTLSHLVSPSESEDFPDTVGLADPPSVVLVRKCKLLTLRCEANSMTKIPIWLVGQWYALNVREDRWSMV